MSSTPIQRRLLILLLAGPFHPDVALAQDASASPQPAEITRESTSEQRSQIESELNAAKAALAAAESDAAAPQDQPLREVILRSAVQSEDGEPASEEKPARPRPKPKE